VEKINSLPSCVSQNFGENQTSSVTNGEAYPMSNEVSWHVELVVKPGRLEEFRTLTGEMVQFTEREPGVLAYERYISEDGKVVHVYERYLDSAAAVAHLLAFEQAFGGRFAGLVERKRFMVFGAASDALRRILDRYGATYASYLDGFRR
jgi:quinol monooxygenase YgiN